MTTPSDSNFISHEHWIYEFTKYNAMASKAESNTANKAKKLARETLASNLNRDFPALNLTAESVTGNLPVQ